MTRVINLTDSAISKCADLLSRESRDDLRLRVAVQPGGCSGLIYNLFFDNKIEESDILEDFGDFEVITDSMSVPYIEGCTVDYQDTIQSQGFTLDNPNAQGTCACGDSFN
jgi:iron-sulfur cluster assembly accessory protein